MVKQLQHAIRKVPFTWISQYREEYSRNCGSEVEREDVLEMKKGCVQGVEGGGGGRPLTCREFGQLKQVSKIVERLELSNELYQRVPDEGEGARKW